MARKLAFILAAALAVVAQRPALAQEPPYGDPNDPVANGGGPPPPAEGPNVDVDVDIGTNDGSVDFQTFHDDLAPYGEWVTTPNYGRVWRPQHVAAGWRPYYYGRWEWTDEGWLWVSDEQWGWATYHYGRWGYDPSFGWVWVPGYQWAPAWVTWRYSPEYVGWAPLAPGFSVYVTSYPVQVTWWSFVPCDHFVGYPVHTVAYGGAYVPGLYRRTMPAPPRATMYGAAAPAWGGPARPVIERHVGRPITPVRLQPVGSPAALRAPRQAGVVPIYRPEARPGRGSVATSSPRPWSNGQPVRPPGVQPNRPYAAPAWRPNGAPTAPRGEQPAWPGAGQGRQGYVPQPQRSPQTYAPPAAPRQGYAPQPQRSPQTYAPPAAPRQGYAPLPQRSPQTSAPPAAPRQNYAPQQGGAGHGGSAPAGGGSHGGGGGHAPSGAHRR